jgi:RNA recognition motif-containing protein
MGTKIYIGNLSYACTESDLEDLLSPFGLIKRLSVPENREGNGPCCGFAFCDFLNELSASRAIDQLNGTTFMGRALKVDYARPPRPLVGSRRDDSAGD